MSKITFENQSIIINDAAKQGQVMTTFLLSINILNPILFISGSDEPITYWLNILWLTVGSISIFVLLFYAVKRSFQKELKRNSIQSISSKSTSLGRSITFKLKNGKTRVVSFSDKSSLASELNALQQNNYDIL